MVVYYQLTLVMEEVINYILTYLIIKLKHVGTQMGSLQIGLIFYKYRRLISLLYYSQNISLITTFITEL